ncbi:amidase family protein [soil metagenome]
MSELWELGAGELAERIRAGALTSREVLDAHLARVEAVNPRLNAIVRVLADEAREAADAADRAVAAGGPVGRLHGVPFTVKENVDLAGTPTTHGLSALADAVADRDAPSVERMRAAGGIPFARTNLPDLGLRIHTHSDLHGATVNPWDPGVTPGGSSGGEAAAIATGMSPIGIGNDIGGSLRNPAHCCGIASIKPSSGVVPMATVIPPEDSPISSQLMAVEGPMARSVADVRLGLQIMAGAHPRDPRSLPVVLTDLAPDQRIRIALMAEPPGGATDPGIAAAVRRAADVLTDAGHEVVEATPPGYEELFALWGALLMSDLRSMRPVLDAVMGEAATAVLTNFETGVPPMSTDEVLGLHVRRSQAMREWSAFFVEHPVLLSPTWALPAFAPDADIESSLDGGMLEVFRPVLAANVLSLPAAVVPVGSADGLPVGVQVIGDRFTDLRCLAIAEQIERASGRLTPIEPRESRVTSG